MWRLALLAMALSASECDGSHKVFRIKPENSEQLEFLRSLDNREEEGLSFWKSPSSLSQAADLMVSPGKLANLSSLMSSRGIAYESLIESVEELLAAESNETTRTRGRGRTFGWARYHNLEEINSWMESLASEHPSSVEQIVAGRSYEGRRILGLKLSFGRTSKPGVFLEGGIHAREWISPATVTYLADRLLRSQEPRIRALAEAHDWYIFPVFNPDGYAYTHLNPRNVHYRFWRKTRFPNRGSCRGTDMNRNWPFQWMAAGASGDPCSEAYAGPAPLSAVEAESLARYIGSISDKLFAYLAFHSYSQLLMFPYGHTTAHLDNYDQALAIAQKSAAALSNRYGTRYRTGTIGQVIGLASGGSVDWVKATLKLPLVYIYELRDTGNTGFLLPPNQIIPNGQEVLDSLLALFQEANNFGYPSL